MEISYKDIEVKNARIKQSIYSYLKMNGYSENYLKNLRKELGYIKLNGQICMINTIVSDGDIISVNKNPNTKTSICSCIIPLDIVYEDDDVLAVNKPSNLSTMPTRSHFSYNLSGGVLHYMEQKDPNFVVRVINRLDKEACGIVLIAKNSLACNFLNKPENTKKTYYALCEGNIKKDLVIDFNIKTILNEYGYNLNKRIISEEGKSAITNVCVIKNFDNYCLVKINLQHGRTHQIRLHMSSIGHSLIGDTLYGQKSNFGHTALICKELEFVQPTTKKLIKLNIPYPDDFMKMIKERG